MLIDGGKLHSLDISDYIRVQEGPFPHGLPIQWVIKLGRFGTREVKNGSDGFRLVLLIVN